MSGPRLEFPGGKRFAFTIIDDTDVATVENVRPIYRLLESLGMRTTKTVWPVACPEGSPDFDTSETLDDAPYREFVRDLGQRGFELTWHGATMESSPRERTVSALERFRELLGAYPRIHVNHAYNRENIYWGGARFDLWPLRLLFGRFAGLPAGHFQGDDPNSPFWWGDLCQAHFSFARNLTFDDINVLHVNPSMPYYDPARPLVRYWFSATDAEDAVACCHVLREEAQDRLEQEGGVCILATHLGKGYSAEGGVHAGVRERFEALARRPGWFVPVGTLLDWLLAQRSDHRLPASEWRGMQIRWAWDLMRRKLRERGQAALA